MYVSHRYSLSPSTDSRAAVIDETEEKGEVVAGVEDEKASASGRVAAAVSNNYEPRRSSSRELSERRRILLSFYSRF